MGIQATGPSGLFPSGPPRRTYREPHPVRLAAVLAGVGAGTGWIVLLGTLGGDPGARGWWTVAASSVAWIAALALARYGDRGVAVGLALAGGAGWTAVTGLLALYWMATGDFPLW